MLYVLAPYAGASLVWVGVGVGVLAVSIPVRYQPLPLYFNLERCW